MAKMIKYRALKDVSGTYEMRMYFQEFVYNCMPSGRIYEVPEGIVHPDYIKKGFLEVVVEEPAPPEEKPKKKKASKKKTSEKKGS